MSHSEILQLDKIDDGVAVLTLNRPTSRNALSSALRGDIADCLKALESDDDVKSAVLTGAGEVFCAGFDLKELAAGHTEEIFAEARKYHHAVHTFTKPLIAAVNGPAMAGGMDLAFMCDIRLGCGATRFGQPQVRMGIPAAYDLMRSVTDESTARHICLTGDVLDADAALARGLVSALYADGEQLRAEALACAALMAQSDAGKTMKAQFLAQQPRLFD
jgi:enoyl-CoA hydratase